MNYSVEEINDCTKKIVFNFESLDLADEIKMALLQKQKTANLKGFRKGKAPLPVIEKMYRPQVESDALNQFIQNRFFEAINEEKIRLVGYPSFENVNYEAGKKVSFEAIVETFPAVELKDLDKLSFEYEKSEVTDEDVNRMRDSYLGSKAEMKGVEGKPLESGSFAVINFKGTKADGTSPENMAAQEFLLEIGSNQFIPGFEEGLIGASTGETKKLELTFPEDYHVEELKSAPVTFEVEILEIKEKILPDFTDEMAKEFGFESTEDFNTKTEQNIRLQKEKQVKEKLHQDILEKLVETHSFDIPQALIAQQENILRKDVEKSLDQQGFNEEMKKEYYSKWEGDIKDKAKFRVKSGLILDKLAQDYSIEAEESDFDAKLEESAKLSGVDVAQVKQYYDGNQNLKQNLMYAIREEKTFDKIKEIVTVKEK
ncbi:MAG: trigger factor [Bacteriovoracaceae bacterium]